MINGTVSGNLGRDAELRQTPNGDPICSFSVASNSKVKGEKITTWVRCSLFGKRATALASYLTKGTKVAVSGSFELREFTNKAGETKASLEVRVSEIDLLGGGDRSSAPSESSRSGGGGYDDDMYGPSAGDDDIPF